MITTTPRSDQNRHEPSAHGSVSVTLNDAAPVGNLRRASLVVLPTYNERENLESIVMTVLERGHDVLIVDDNSPDGTGDLADRLSASLDGVKVLHRVQKLGLGSAYREGFQVGLEQDYEFILQMDADGSHLPHDLHRLIEAARVSNGLAIGSRYIAGGTISGWSLERRILSKAANVYSRLLLRHSLFDWTSGYRCYTSRALKAIGLNTIQSTGFDFQIEAAFRCLEHGVPVTEVPIHFKEREVGQSKASATEIRLGLLRVAHLRSARALKRGQPLNLRRSTSVAHQPPAVHCQELVDAGVNSHPLQSAVIGVLVHNEASTIEKCLRSILGEHDGEVRVRSVIVVASGCTDATPEITQRIASSDPRVRLVLEEERSGKVAAINLLLAESSEPIVVTMGGDMVFTKGSLVRLLEPFKDAAVGMTGVRPIPTNPRVGIVGNAVNILWDLHHELAMQSPKLGEAVAFRRISTFEPGTVFDEATMERIALSRGFELRYVPEATVRNRGPETLREYLRHRSRNIREHLAMASSTGYHVATLNLMACLRATWRLWRRGERARYIGLALALEGVASTLARISLFTGHAAENVIWHPITTAKRVIADGHMLRVYHDGFQTIRIRPNPVGSRLERRVVDSVRRITRADDRVLLRQAQVTVKVRTDIDGALMLCARLQAVLPHLSTILDSGRVTGGSPRETT